MNQRLRDRYQPLREEFDNAELTVSEQVALWDGIETRVAGPRRAKWRWAALGTAVSAMAVALLAMPWPASNPEDSVLAHWNIVSDNVGCAKMDASRLSVSDKCATAVDIKLGQDRIAMAPGSTLQREKRGVRLVRGHGRFEVEPRKKAPSFKVEVSEGTITVLGTLFDVHQNKSGGHVELESGTIRFDWRGGRSPQTLQPGESLSWGNVAEEEEPTEIIDPAEDHALAPARGAKKRKRRTFSTPEQVFPDVGAALAHVYSLRSQRRYDEAIALLKHTISQGGFDEHGRAKLSYEIGKILRLKDAPKAERCAHWKTHLQRYAPDKNTPEIEKATEKCGR